MRSQISRNVLLIRELEAISESRLDMALKFGNGKNIAHLGCGMVVGLIGKTIFDRLYGPSSKDETSSLDLEDVEVKYGIPTRTIILENDSYIVGYNTSRKIPDWVFQCINRESFIGQAKREHCSFKEDPRIAKLFSSSTNDYHKSGFSRGHMASAGDNKASQKLMDDTFYYTNIVPQNGGNNKGIWYQIECYCRKLAEKYSNVFVISGPLFIAERDATSGKKFVSYQVIGPNEVAVPTHFYKVILVERENAALALGTFVIPNRHLPNEKKLDKFAYPLSFVEERLGYEIFPKLKRENLGNLCSIESCELKSFNFLGKN